MLKSSLALSRERAETVMKWVLILVTHLHQLPNESLAKLSVAAGACPAICVACIGSRTAKFQPQSGRRLPLGDVGDWTGLERISHHPSSPSSPASSMGGLLSANMFCFPSHWVAGYSLHFLMHTARMRNREELGVVWVKHNHPLISFWLPALDLWFLAEHGQGK